MEKRTLWAVGGVEVGVGGWQEEEIGSRRLRDKANAVCKVGGRQDSHWNGSCAGKEEWSTSGYTLKEN